jgi:nucleoid-associated protein YgaU
LSVATVLGVGLCAALPYYRPRNSVPEPRTAAAPSELTLRRSDSPLVLPARSDISPARELESVTPASAQLTSLTAAPLAPAPDLGKLAPPPTLPVSFQPTTDSFTPGQWRPSREPPVDYLRRQAGAARPARRYRLRDGDTLEKLAQRFLGSADRAEEIYELNRDVLTRPDLLPLGVTIVIPSQARVGDLDSALKER